MADQHAKADAILDSVLHGGAGAGYGKKKGGGRDAQYRDDGGALGNLEHHSDELGLLEDMGSLVGVGNLFDSSVHPSTLRHFIFFNNLTLVSN